jgi:hypothetical protein
MKLSLILTLAAMALPQFALARDLPQVPASAQKLDAAGIYKLYHGNRSSFNNLQNKETLTGVAYYDLDSKVMFGIFNWDNKDRGLFKGKAWIKDDEFCNKPDKGKQTCTLVYLDGKTYYEVSKDGVVQSVDTLLDTPPAIPDLSAKLTPDEVMAIADGKTVDVHVFDGKKPTVARSLWNAKKMRVSGEYLTNGTDRGKFKIKFSKKDDKICFQQDKLNCYSYLKVQGGFMEINSDGKVHAVSILP